METRQARSRADDAQTALAAIRAELGDDFAPDLVVAFVASKYEARTIAGELARTYPRAVVVGCTTAGEILDGERGVGSVVVSALRTPSIRWAARMIKDVGGAPDVAGAVGSVCGALSCDREGEHLDEYFAMVLVDGVSGTEETLGAALADALAGIPLVGGSAGDDLAFRETQVFVGGDVASNAAALVLAHAPRGFDLLKHQHYVPTPTRVAVTAADPATRRVDELDGRPAAEAFAEAIGLPPGRALADETFLHPVTFSCRGEAYVRSVRTVEPDGAMHFYCAVEPGMVLEISGREDMTHALARSVETHLRAHGRADAFIGFNCILRALEMEQLRANRAIANEWSRLATHSIGFDTYGEMWKGLHINQTLVGIALHEPRQDATT